MYQLKAERGPTLGEFENAAQVVLALRELFNNKEGHLNDIEVREYKNKEDLALGRHFKTSQAQYFLIYHVCELQYFITMLVQDIQILHANYVALDNQLNPKPTTPEPETVAK